MSNGEEIPLLLDELGLPQVLPNAHVLALSRNSGKSPSSQEQRLRGIDRGLAFFAKEGIDLITRVASGDFLSLDELNDLSVACRARADGKGQIGGATAGFYWDAVQDYITWHADAVIGRAHGANKEMLVRQRDEFRKRSKAARPNSSAGPTYPDRLGLKPQLRELLLEVTKPGSKHNPFHPKVQIRNRALILVGLELGLRGGEELCLRVSDYDPKQCPPTLVVVPRAPDPNDKRKKKPRVKTLGRLLEPPEYVCAAIEAWRKERRDMSKYPNARRHGYMFVEWTGDELAERSLRSIYERLGEAIEVLAGISSHIVRHSAADLDTELADAEGWPEDEWRRHMTYKFGWAAESVQPFEYAKGATSRKVNARLRAQQRRDLGLE